MEWLSKNVEWLFSGAGIVAIGWVVNWIRLRNTVAKESPTTIQHSVVSHNQSGGITAHTVNIAEKKRQLSEGSQRDLEKLRFAEIQVYGHQYSDSQEITNFWNDLQNHLHSAGWQVTLSALHVADNSIQNIVIEVNAKILEGDNALLAAETLSQTLKAQRITCEIRRITTNPLPRNAIYLRVGPIN